MGTQFHPSRPETPVGDWKETEPGEGLCFPTHRAKSARWMGHPVSSVEAGNAGGGLLQNSTSTEFFRSL
jgi:hypothetical protein